MKCSYFGILKMEECRKCEILLKYEINNPLNAVNSVFMLLTMHIKWQKLRYLFSKRFYL